MKKFLCVVFAGFAVLHFAGCSKSGGSQPTPSAVSAKINSVSQERTTTASVFKFSVTLDKAATSNVSVHYTTQEGDAKAPADFTAATGTLTINAGQTKGDIEVTVTGDSIRKDNQLFYVQLDNPQGCTITTSKGTGTIINENGSSFPVSNAGYTTPDNYPGYTLVWSDEFATNTINPATWTFETGAGGWGNNELENYTSSQQNAFVSQGNLIIEARRINSGGSTTYTSARMITKNQKTFTYGRVDIRAKLPIGKGIWPALWMLGNNIDATGWPACGEIDIMELLGQEPNKMYGTVHYGSSFATHQSKGTSYTLSSGNFNDAFHVYSMIWTADSIKLLVDDTQFFATDKAGIGTPYPFDNPFFFIFNIAVGGNWPGSPDGSTVFPQRMIVDYVRVFQ